jgi:hypothetical protein
MEVEDCPGVPPGRIGKLMAKTAKNAVGAAGGTWDFSASYRIIILQIAFPAKRHEYSGSSIILLGLLGPGRISYLPLSIIPIFGLRESRLTSMSSNTPSHPTDDLVVAQGRSPAFRRPPCMCGLLPVE